MIVVVNRKAIFVIVIVNVHIAFIERPNIFAIAHE